MQYSLVYYKSLYWVFFIVGRKIAVFAPLKNLVDFSCSLRETILMPSLCTNFLSYNKQYTYNYFFFLVPSNVNGKLLHIFYKMGTLNYSHN